MKSTKLSLVESIFSNLTNREPAYFLADFLNASGNEFARKLFESLLEKNEPQLGLFNPIYLWGPSGCGKTHLMVGIASSLRKESQKVFYATCDTFTGAIIQAIRSECLNEFQHELRSCSVFMIDEVSDLSNRWRIQEEFFHAFNTLRTAGKQIIISSQAAPHQLVAIKSRLISRFEWGLLVPMTGLTEEEQCKYLHQVLHAKGFTVEQTIYPKLAKVFRQEMNQFAHWLETLLTKKITDKDINPLLEEKAALQKKRPDLQEILDIVSFYFHVKKEEILSTSQKKKIATPRRVAMYLCRFLLNLPLNKIGYAFRRDNTTVSLSCKTISELLLIDKNLKKQIEEIKKSLLS